ncbi:MAG: ribosome maturation factor RimM [Defluviitaleaceae bacterium]|nr:ribosome maturation factor RimM [Defluviitaleaceae bacterium]
MRYFDVGKIVNTHGIRGLVKVVSQSDDPDKFFKLKSVIIDGKDVEVEQASTNKQFVLLKLKGIDDMNAAEALKGKTLKVPESDALKLAEGEYFIRDIYDMEVYEENGEFLGTIDDIIFTGANDVYVVKKEGTKDLLIPAIKSCILNVNMPEKRMTVYLLEGLRDL